MIVNLQVNGERNPEEVYKDFRAAVLQILGAVEDQEMNGVGVGARGMYTTINNLLQLMNANFW